MAILKGWKNPDSPRGPITIDPGYPRHRAEHLHAAHRDAGRQLANVEFDTIPDVKDPWKELNPK